MRSWPPSLPLAPRPPLHKDSSEPYHDRVRPLARRDLLVAVLLSGLGGSACVPFGTRTVERRAPGPAIVQPAMLEGRRSEGFFETTLVAAPATVPLRDGRPAEVWAYNGAVPGPTLEVTEGDRVVIHFKNRLPEPSNIHWHGLHVPPDQDGLPMDLVPPGGSRDYVFTIPRGTAGTYWYHPHPHGSTATQVLAGLAGSLRVRPAVDPVPPEFGDDILFISDNRFDKDGKIAPLTDSERTDGRFGDVILVNGRERPQIGVRSGEIRRLRFINASTAQAWRLQVPGHSFLLIGTDGGHIGAPVERDEIRLAPAERAEVLLRMSAPPGTRTELRALPFGHSRNGHPGDGTSNGSDLQAAGPGSRPGSGVGTGHAAHFEIGAAPGSAATAPTPGIPQGTAGATSGTAPEAPRTIADIVYDDAPPIHPAPVPSVLRPIAPLSLAGAVTRTLVLREFTIDDRSFDPGRVDVRGKLGTTEVWTVRNAGRMDHPFHLHGFQFQILDRDGAPEPFRAWKDTVMVGNGQSVRFAVKFENFAGLRVYHCHVLWHEDKGMMGLLQVDP